MNKEELKEEAEDYANRTRIKDKNTYVSFDDECISSLQDYEGNYMDISERIVKTYIDSAEPREKRIVELEKESDVLRESYSNSEMNLNYATNQLTKAKKLLKWALHSDPEHDEDFDQKWEEAEQFISEVEK